MGKLCNHCSQAVPVWDDHLMCVKCRFAAGICTLDANNAVRAGRLASGASFRSPSEMPGRKQSREEHSTGRVTFPHLLIQIYGMCPFVGYRGVSASANSRGAARH